MNAKLHPFKLGRFECLVIQDQTATMPLANLVVNADPGQVEQVALELGLPAEGITLGYNCLLVRTGEHNVLVDTVIHPIFVEHGDWASTFDSVPDKALAARQRLLDRAASEESLVFGAHFPFPGLGYVRHGDEGWQWVQAPAGGQTQGAAEERGG